MVSPPVSTCPSLHWAHVSTLALRVACVRYDYGRQDASRSSASQRESWSIQKQDACYHCRCRVGAHSLLHERDDLVKRRQRAPDRSQQRRLVSCWLDLAAICAARHNALGAVAAERVAS